VKGASVNELCARDEFPSDCTIYRWFHENEDFREKYQAARALQADFLADEIIPIVDGKLPVLNKLDGGMTLPDLDTPVRVSRDVARAKYRAWKAGRMAPRKWGERIDDNHEMGAITPPIIVIHSSADVRSNAQSKANRRKEHDGD
jgi:hypothetical protein